MTHVKLAAVKRASQHLLTLLLALSVIQPLPSQINESEKNNTLLAPQSGTAILHTSVSEEITLTPLTMAKERWTQEETKPLGTMLEPNPDGSFTLPPKRRVQGLPKIRFKDEKHHQTMLAKGYYLSGGFYHARPTVMIQEKVVDNFRGEIGIPRLELHKKVKAFVLQELWAPVESKKIKGEQLVLMLQNEKFRQNVAKTFQAEGETLEHLLFLLNKFVQRIAQNDLKLYKISPKVNTEKPDKFDLAFKMIMTDFIAEDDVVVESIAAGLNSNGDWAATGFPISILNANYDTDFHVLGSDLCGRVVAAGSKVLATSVDEGGFRIGDLVVFQTGTHNLLDPEAHGGHPGRLKSYHITGYEDPFGTFTDFYKYNATAFMRVTEKEMLEKVRVLENGDASRGATFEEMASYGLVLPTVEHAINRLGLTTNQILIMEGGNGGTGRYGIQAAKKRGAFVIGIVSSEERGKEVLELGADAYINRSMSKMAQVDNAFKTLKDFLENSPDTNGFGSALKIQIKNVLDQIKDNLGSKGIRTGLEGLIKGILQEVSSEKFKKIDEAFDPLLKIEEEQPQFLSRAYRVLNGKASYEDHEIVHSDYVKQVKSAVRKLIKKHKLGSRSDLADAVINFMGTETYARHALSVRQSDPAKKDLGGLCASFGGGSGFKVQYPGAFGAMPIDVARAKISMIRRRSGIREDIDRAVVMGASEWCQEDVAELVKNSPGTRILVVAQENAEVQQILTWGLLRKGIDGIVDAGAAKEEILREENLQTKLNKLQAIRERSFQVQPTFIFAKNQEEGSLIQKSSFFNAELDNIIFENEVHVYSDLDFEKLSPDEITRIKDQMRDIRKTGKYIIVIAKNQLTRNTIFNWSFWMEKDSQGKPMYDPKKDIIIQNYGIDLTSSMPETPTPFSYAPTEEELKAHKAKEKTYQVWQDAGPKALGKSFWLHWGQRKNPDLIFGRASWNKTLAHMIFVLDPMGQVVIRGDMSDKVYDFDIRDFWMRQKILITPTQIMVGTHYASPREALDSHKKVLSGDIHVAPVNNKGRQKNSYPWQELGSAQENIGTGKNVIRIGANKEGQKTIKEIVAGAEKESAQALAHASFEKRAFAATQLHWMAEKRADSVLETYKVVSGLRELLYKPATCGVCVEPATFKKIQQAWGVPDQLIHKVESQNALEFELHLSGGVHLDILTVIDRKKESALTSFLDRNGEGVQQVEIFTSDTAKVTELIQKNSKALGGKLAYAEPIVGASGTPVNFHITKAQGSNVLLEFVQGNVAQLAKLPAVKQKINLTSAQPFYLQWLEEQLTVASSI